MKQYLKLCPIMGLGLGLLAHPAHAGHWDVSPSSASGKVSWRNNGVWEDIWDWEEEGWYTIDPANGSNAGRFNLWTSYETGQLPGNSGMRTKGIVSLVFTWVPDTNAVDDPPPAKVTIREDSEGYVYRSPNGTGVYTLNNGIGGEEVTYQPGYWSAPDSGRKKFASVVKSYEVSSGQVILPPRNFEVSINDDQGQDLGVQLYYGASIDDRNRNIGITRNVPSGSPAVKQENDSTLRKERDNWIKKDGTGYGHGRWSYYESVLVPDGNSTLIHDDAHNVIESFAAVPAGQWSSNTIYKWDPSEVTDTKEHHTQATPQGGSVNNPDGIYYPNPGGVGGATSDDNHKGWDNVPSQGDNPLVIKYSLTDDDGAKGEARYELTLHDEWEDPKPDPRFGADADGLTHEEYYIVPSGAQAETRANASTWTIGQNSKFTVSLSTEFKLGFAIKDWVNASGSGNVSKEIEITQNMSSGAPNLSSSKYNDFSSDTRFLTVVVYQATRAHKLLNHFGQYGFAPDSTTTSIWPEANPLWGRTPQNKIEDLTAPRADWLPFLVQQGAPADGSSGTWDFSGSVN